MNNKNTNLAKRNHSYQGLKHLQRTLDNFFSDIWWPTGIGEEWESFQPHSKFSEDKDHYYLEIDLPGLKKEEVKIEVEDHTLRVQGERKESKKPADAKQHYSEVFYGSFTRRFTLPTAIEKAKIKAQYEQGVLFITLPKTAHSKAQVINIE